MPTSAFKPSIKHPEYEKLSSSDWRFSVRDMESINDMIQFFNGTRRYHNFTKKLTYRQDSSSRHILSFRCQEIFTSDGVEFARFIIVGQSFLYHQIRKMMGLVVSVYRDGAPWDVLPAVHQDRKSVV